MEIYLKFAENKAIGAKRQGQQRRKPCERSNLKSRAAGEERFPAAAQMFVKFLLLMQDLHLRVLLPKPFAQRTDILPGLAILLTVFNELVRLKQCRGGLISLLKKPIP